MKLLIYADESTEAGRRILEIVRQAASKEPIEICRTVKCLGEMLRPSLEGCTLAIVLTKSIGELRQIQALGNSIFKPRLILILPDRDEETIAIAHSLRSRFLTFANGDFLDVKAVIEKMVRQKNYVSELDNPNCVSKSEVNAY